MTQKKVVLTGAGGGIGKAISHALDKQGYLLVLVDLQQASLAELNRDLQDKHQCIEADLTQQAGIDAVVSTCELQGEGIDLLVNCAGVSHFDLFANTQLEKIQQMMDVNVVSVMRLTQALMPLLRQPQASIINIGSTFGSIGYPGFSAYCASKFAIRGFSEALRRELADTHIDVRYFAPRATQTSINSDQVVIMNKHLGVQMDSVDQVASEFIQFMNKQKKSNYFVGWPEKLFVKINGLFPQLVENSIAKQLPIIKKYL